MIDLSPKIKKWLSLAGKVLLILVVAGGIAWFTLINPYLIRQEKKRFESAAASLQQLSEEIQAKIGKADEITKDESCDRANLKYSQGPLGCDTGFQLRYPVGGTDDANALLADASKLSAYELREGPLTNSTTFVIPPASKNKSTQIIYQDIRPIEGLSCSISYEYRFDRMLEGDKKHSFNIIISCGGPAKAEHYSLEN